MGATTPKLAIPYVTATDMVAAYPAADQAQATKVEQLFTARTSRTPDWVTAAAGWSVTASNIDIFTKLALWTATFSRTGAAVTVPATGDIATQLLGTFATATYSVLGLGPITSTEGRLASVTLVASQGQLNLTAVAPGANIATGESLSFAGLFFLS